MACHDDPSLRGKVVAVGGSVEERHGIILAKNENAKKFGIATGDAIWQAKQKCPSLIVVPPDFKRYTYFSGEARKIYSRYTDLIEPFGIDECWLDVTGSRLLFGDGHTIAERIRREMRTELGLTISVGVSFNKIFAKLGSDLKKPDATSDIPYEHFKEIVWPLEVSALLGVGRATEKKLKSLAIYTVGDLASVDVDILRLKLGKAGEQLWYYANGLENSDVLKENFKYRPKSIGRSVTCPRDLYTADEVKKIFLRLSEEVAKELRKEDLEACGIQIHLRTNDLEVKEFMANVDTPIQSASALAREGMKLFTASFDFSMPLRSVGIRAIRLRDYSPEYQLSLFEENNRQLRHDILEASVDKIRDKYGNGILLRGSLMHDFTAFRDQSPSTLGHMNVSHT